MKFKLTIKARRWTVWLSVLAVVVALISASAVAISKPSPTPNFITTVDSGVSSLNYLRDSSGDSIYGSLVEGLVTVAPKGSKSDQSDSIAKVLDVPKITILSYLRDDSKFDKFGDTTSGYGLRDWDQVTWGAAESAKYLSETNANTGVLMHGTRWKFKIRQDSLWRNGDRVSAEDFIQTIRYIVDLKNSSTLVREFRDAIPIRGAQALIKEQEDYNRVNGRYRSEFSEYANYSRLFGENGGVYALKDPLDPNSEFLAHPGAETTSHSNLYYGFEDNNPDSNFFTKMGKQMFLPTNKRFIDSIGGFDKFGQSKDTILSNGPFVLESFTPDYEATFVRNEDPNNPLKQWYWDVKRVLAPRWSWRVIPEVSTQIYLFQQGKVAEVGVSPAFLKVFRESPSLKRLLFPGGSGIGTTMFKWNLAKPIDGAGSSVPEVVNNVHFRRAFSLAIDRKAIMDINGVGSNTKPGDVFSTGQSFFKDSNNNLIENYFWRTNYSLNGRNLGPMVQYDPYLQAQFEKAEYVDGIRVDRWRNLDAAHEEYEKFLNDLPQYRNQTVNIKVLFSSSSNADVNQILRAKQSLAEVFGDKISFNLQARPQTTFAELTRQNNGYDLALVTQTADVYDDSWTFLRLLAAEPPLGTKVTATINTSGNWTYADGLKWIMLNEPQRLTTELGFKSQAEVDDLLLLLETIKGSSQASLYGGVLSSMGYTDSQKMELYTKLEIIIRDQAPLVPIYQRRASWYARRTMGSTNLSGFTLSYKYTYNGNPADVPYSPYYNLPPMA